MVEQSNEQECCNATTQAYAMSEKAVVSHSAADHFSTNPLKYFS